MTIEIIQRSLPLKGVGDPIAVEVQPDEALIHRVSSELDEAYYHMLESVQERPALEKQIKIVYSPLHGTGYVPVTTMFRRLGYEFFEVSGQCEPDGNFSYTDSPNPENPKSFVRAIEVAKDVDADLVLATDPDCDRIGVVAKDSVGEYRYGEFGVIEGRKVVAKEDYLNSVRIESDGTEKSAVVAQE